VEIAKEHLRSLKDQLDACSSTADLISKQMSFANPPKQRTTTMSSAYSVNLGTLSSLEVSKDESQEIDLIVERLKSAFAQLSEGSYASSSSEIRRLTDEFKACGSEFEELSEKLDSEPIKDPKQQEKRLYYVLMEAALCFYWAGRIINNGSNFDNSDALSVEEANGYLEKSLKLYQKTSSKIDFKKDAILAYRVANVLSELGDEDMALDKFKEAAANLEKIDQPNLAADHYLRVRIPRQLGLALWDAAHRYRNRAQLSAASDFMVETRRNLYLEALETTLPLISVHVQPSSFSGEGEKGIDESLMTSNNVLEYAISFIRAGGDVRVLEQSDAPPSLLSSIAEDLEKQLNENKLEMPLWMDTVRSYHCEVSLDFEKAKTMAQSLIGIIEADRHKWEMKYGNRFIEEMLADAEKTLDR
jgi:tetratricopeptide (TPR) repeat protein